MAKIISFSIPNDFYSELVEIEKNSGLSGRSETIRVAMRTFQQQLNETKALKGIVRALLVISHSHANDIDKIGHLYEGEILTRMHQHLENKCVDIFILKGNADAIKELMKTISRNKKIHTLKLLII